MDAGAAHATGTLGAPAKDPDAIKLFVGQVPKSVEVDELRTVFEPYGPIHEMAVIKDRTTGMHKGARLTPWERGARGGGGGGRVICTTSFHWATCVLALVCRGSACVADASVFLLSGSRRSTPCKSSRPSRTAVRACLGRRLPSGTGMPLLLTRSSNRTGVSSAETKLFVGMLPRTVTDDELRALFEQFGMLDEASVLRSPDGMSKGVWTLALRLPQPRVCVCAYSSM
jgi:CUG-BP- and ETR3-like factor